MSRRVVVKKKKKFESTPLPCQVIVSPIFSWQVFRCCKQQHKIIDLPEGRKFPVCKGHYDDWLKGSE